MARIAGVSQSSVPWRVWRAFQLKPHRRETFTLSNDQFFVEKVREVAYEYVALDLDCTGVQVSRVRAR